MEDKRQNLIIALFGVLLLIIAFFLKDAAQSFEQFLFEAVFSIAFILMTIAIVNAVWHLLGGEPVQKVIRDLKTSTSLLSDGEASGLTRIVASSGSFGTHHDWVNIVARAKRQVDLQGYTLLVWTRSEAFGDTLVNLARNGVKVRLLFMDEGADNIEAGINSRQIAELTVENVKNEIAAMTKFLDLVIAESSKAPSSGSIEYRKVKKGLIVAQICRVDGRAYFTPYLQSANTSQCPLLVIENADRPLFAKVQREFECMWNADQTP